MRKVGESEGKNVYVCEAEEASEFNCENVYVSEDGDIIMSEEMFSYFRRIFGQDFPMVNTSIPLKRLLYRYNEPCKGDDISTKNIIIQKLREWWVSLILLIILLTGTIVNLPKLESLYIKYNKHTIPNINHYEYK